MKSGRHARMLKLISEYEINTQEELLKRLNENGFKVTQATVSRDIKELRLIKVQSDSGGYKYSTNTAKENVDMSFKFHAVFSESVDHVDYAENMVVIKCYFPTPLNWCNNLYPCLFKAFNRVVLHRIAKIEYRLQCLVVRFLVLPVFD